MTTSPSPPLIDVISSPKALKAAWDLLNKGNPKSRGLSRETIEEFKNSLEIQILEISKLLKANKYKFNGVRAVLIPKKTAGEFRPLRIADIRDRLVQKSLSITLENLLSSKYKLKNDCSFAYQEDLGVEKAIKKSIEHFQNGNRIILEADIKKFFDTVNRGRLLEKIFANLPDNTINNLIEQSLAQNVGNLDSLDHEYHYYFTESINGIPQGNSLSPLLANIYLSDFDQRMIKEGFCLVRYADDFIILCKTTKDARKAYEISKEELEDKLGLQLHPLPNPPHDKSSKTRIIDPFHHEFSFLSIRFDGKNVWVNPKKLSDLLEKINTITDVEKYKGDKDYKGLLTILVRLKNLLEGWLASYKFVDVDREFVEIDSYINHKLLQVFNKLQYKIKSSHTDTIKIKSTGKFVQGFNHSQRINTGVFYCNDFIKTLERNQIKV